MPEYSPLANSLIAAASSVPTNHVPTNHVPVNPFISLNGFTPRR